MVNISPTLCVITKSLSSPHHNLDHTKAYKISHQDPVPGPSSLNHPAQSHVSSPTMTGKQVAGSEHLSQAILMISTHFLLTLLTLPDPHTTGTLQPHSHFSGNSPCFS